MDNISFLTRVISSMSDEDLQCLNDLILIEVNHRKFVFDFYDDFDYNDFDYDMYE